MEETDAEYRTRIMQEATAKAAEHSITLKPSDFTLYDGGVYLDGMDPLDWVHSMTMD